MKLIKSKLIKSKLIKSKFFIYTLGSYVLKLNK